MDADQTGTPQGGAARVRRHKYFAQQDLGAGAIHLPRACSISLGWSDHRERNPKIRPSAKGRWSYFCQAASIRIFRFIRFHYQVTYIYFLTIMGFSSPDFHLACEHTFLVAGVISSGQSTWVFY